MAQTFISFISKYYYHKYKMPAAVKSYHTDKDHLTAQLTDIFHLFCGQVAF